VNCKQPGCDGVIDDGFCTTCGMAPERETTATTPAPRTPASAATPQTGSATTKTGNRGARTTRTSSSGRSHLGAGLVEIPTVEEHDPMTDVLEDPRIAEEKRFCSNPACGAPVGRRKDNMPGRPEGFCTRCGSTYSFTPSLKAGDLLGGQYEVAGCIAHGGLGWIYLARDKNVSDKWVVLKGLLNTNDADAIAAALAERRFLAEVDDHRIVGIINFVQHQAHGYIVMDYVPGTSLRKVLEQRRAANGGEPDPLPVAHALAYIVEILPAFTYLHGRNLIYCDFKPDNIMQTGGSVKLIDLGGVYKLDDPSSAIYGTKGYQAPEIAETGPTVASDLFTVGRTLAFLCTAFHGYQQRYEYTLPAPDEQPLFAQYDSLYRFLLRATAPDPDDRFQSAEEMRDQLLGVLREVVGAETGRDSVTVSTSFTGELSGDTDVPDWHGLPGVLVDTNDPAAGLLASLPAGDPAAALELLQSAPEQTVEVQLRVARENLDAGDFSKARVAVDAVYDDDPWEWRAVWYRGIIDLAAGAPDTAIADLRLVYQQLPGELAPKLALGMTHEAAGEPKEAARWYAIVTRTDRSFTQASFGLARCALAMGDRAAALDALDRVPESSRSHIAAQCAKAEALLADDTATRADVAAAGKVVDKLRVGTSERVRLQVRVLERALGVVLADGPDETVVLGTPCTEDDVRVALESAYRDSAKHAPDAMTRFEMVDQANAVRPRTLV
jgi:serine/threonine-protein kinase PknG